MSSKKILYVEDDPDDRDMLLLAISESNHGDRLVFAKNGLEAMGYLKQSADKSDLPCVVVLDLNMPYMDGRETFQQMKEDPFLQNLNVVILTSSRNPQDQAYFENLGVEFFCKPEDFSILKCIALRLVHVCDG